MFATVQFETLSTELKERMRSALIDSRPEWPRLYRELSESFSEDEFRFVHIEANSPIYTTKDKHTRSIDFIPVYMKKDGYHKNNKPIILVNLEFSSVSDVFDSIKDAQRVLDKWSEYVYLNLCQFHPTVARVEFQLTDSEQRKINPIKLYNQKNRKGRAGVSVEYAPTVLIDNSSITGTQPIEESITSPDFTFKFIKHDESISEEIYGKVMTKIDNGMLIIHHESTELLNQVLRIAEVMSIRYMITDHKNETLVQSFLHHGFTSSSIVEKSRTGCSISEQNELEITTTSQRISFTSLTEGWGLKGQKTRFFNSLEEFYTIINQCQYMPGGDLRNFFEMWRKQYRDFCWELIDEDQKGPEGPYKSRNNIHPSKDLTNKIHTKIRNCQDIEYLSSLVTKYLKLGDTTDKLHDISGQRIFKKEQVKLYNEVIGSLLSDVFRRHRVPYSQSIYSKYDLTKPPGVYTGLSNLHHPNSDEDLHNLELRGVDFTLVHRLSVYNCIRKFLEKLKLATSYGGNTVSYGLNEFFMIENNSHQEGQE